MDKYDKFAKDIQELGYIKTPYEVIYDYLPDATTYDIIEGLRIILVQNHRVTIELDKENANMRKIIDEAKPLTIPSSEPIIDKKSEPVDNSYTYPQNTQALQIIDSIKYFRTQEEFSKNTSNLSKEAIALIKLHLLKLIKQLEKQIRTKVAIDPLSGTDQERLQILNYKSYLEELMLDQEILIEAEEKQEKYSNQRIILLPHGQNNSYLLEDIQNYPESYGEIYLAFENIMSKKFLGSKSIKSIKDMGDKLYEYTRTNGIRILFIKRGNDIFICSLFYKDKQRSSKITAYYDEAIKRFNSFMSTCDTITTPDFEIEQKELIGSIYGEIEQTQSLSIKKDGE